MNGIFTITAKNYLALAISLGNSLKQHNPEIDFTIFLADSKETGDIDEANIGFKIVYAEELQIPDFRNFAFKYDLIEFNTAIKPFCLEYLRAKGYERILYFDPDILVYGPIQGLFALFVSKDFVVTPHFLELQDSWTGVVPESNFLISGVFNLGFFGINLNSKSGEIFLRWWKNRLTSNCFLDRNDGLFFDQNWVTFLTSTMSDRLQVLPHPGCNVAWWNLHERRIQKINGRYMVKTNGLHDLVFFHYSGYKIGDNDSINRRYPDNPMLKFNSREIDLLELFQDYSRTVLANRHEIFSKVQYGFSLFADGTTILKFHRRLLRILKERDFPRNIDPLQEKIRTSLQLRYESVTDPFDSSGVFYRKLKHERLLTKFKGNEIDTILPGRDGARFLIQQKLVLHLLRFLKKIIGLTRFLLLMKFMNVYSRDEYLIFLIEDRKLL